ncbi:TPA: RNA polymerase sigma factor [Candidatus Poribacteria bacterium]|nr:RNA polymerase sigma factor [Candidatus Poribacteria bacterium]
MNFQNPECKSNFDMPISSLNDYQIILCIQNLFGQAGATEKIEALFAEFYQRHIVSVMALICQRLGQSVIPDQNAEDIAQEAFQGLWKQIKAGRRIVNPSAYLRQIVANCISDAYEKRFHYRQLNPNLSRREIQQKLREKDSSLRHIEETPFETGGADEYFGRRTTGENIEAAFQQYQDDIESQIVHSEFREICYQAIEALPHEHWKSVVRLHKLEGWTYSEIAEALGWDLEKVKGYGKRGTKVFISEIRKRYK